MLAVIAPSIFFNLLASCVRYNVAKVHETKEKSLIRLDEAFAVRIFLQHIL